MITRSVASSRFTVAVAPARWVMCVVLAVSIAGHLGSATVTVAKQTTATVTNCTTTQREYTVKVCLTAPEPGSAIHDDPVFSATVELSDPSMSVLSVDFNMSGRRALSDFDPPYQFHLVASDWVDGTYTMEAVARTSDKEKSDPATAQIRLSSGTMTSPVADSTFVPTSGRPAADGEPYVLAAVGDSAGGSPQSEALTNLIDSWNPNLFLYLGDVYNSGTHSEFMNWYDPDKYVGRFRDITLPTVGNHEYSSGDQPKGYLQYWGNPPHYYSVDTAGWHIVSLDTNPKFNETAVETQQVQWLIDDLARSTSACTLVFFHHPPFSVGSHGNTTELEPIWKLLVENNVTVVLSGHDHDYQRWSPLDGNGQPNPEGTMSLVVGTGGQSEYGPAREDPRMVGPFIETTGALRMELTSGGASMQFITIDGIVHDPASVSCDDATPDKASPSAPTDVNVRRQFDGSIVVTWKGAVDDRCIARYDIIRDGEFVESVPPGTAFLDTGPANGTDPGYQVIAVDGAENKSTPSETALPVGVATSNFVFAESFATGSFARWDRVDGLAIEAGTGELVNSPWVARGRGGTHAAFARVGFPESASISNGTGIRVSVQFQVVEQGSNPLTLIRIRSPEDDSLFGISINANRTLGLYNDVIKQGTEASMELTDSEWHQLVATMLGTEDGITLEVSLDGNLVTELSGPVDLNQAMPGILQLGDSASGRLYDIRFQTVFIERVGGNATPAPATPAGSLTMNAIAYPFRQTSGRIRRLPNSSERTSGTLYNGHYHCRPRVLRTVSASIVSGGNQHHGHA